MTPVGLSLGAGFFFGASAVAIRFGFVGGLRRNPDVASLILAASGFSVAATAAVFTAGPVNALEDLWPFVALGVLSPAASALLWVRAVARAGAARASVFLGTTPLWAVLIALAILDEPFIVPLTIGCLLIVLGTTAVYRERQRPEGFSWIGIPLALGAALLFALRDSGARFASDESIVDPLWAATATLLSGTFCLAVFALATRQKYRLALVRPTVPVPFLVAGACHGSATALLYEALDRARLTVVAPLTSTSALWGVLIAAAVLGRREAVGVRLLIAASCVVAGGALIGHYR